MAVFFKPCAGEGWVEVLEEVTFPGLPYMEKLGPRHWGPVKHKPPYKLWLFKEFNGPGDQR